MKHLVLRDAEDRGITLRLIGALGISSHCKKYAELRSILVESCQT